MKKFYFLLVAILSTASLILAGCGGESKKFRLGTAGSGGTYYAYGAALSKMTERDGRGIALDVKTTAGSAANLRLLREKFLDIAIVQSDMLGDAVKGEGIFLTLGPSESYAAIAGLYPEACQVIVPVSSGIRDIHELVGKRVSVGEKESGVLQNAREILMAHGLTLTMIEPSYLSFSDSAAAMERGEIDAFFCTAGTPTRAVSDLADRMDIRVLAISPGILENMTRMFSGYTRCVIPAGTYRGHDADVTVPGVKAVLVAGSDVSDDAAAYLAGLIVENGNKIRPGDSDVAYATADIPCGFHAGAARFYQTKGVKVETTSPRSGQKNIAGQDS